jgi:multidrug efflux pump subunit AcrA (membrane-fusion protein)
VTGLKRAIPFVRSINFEEGQEVTEGDVLFTLDDRAVRAQLQQTEATLEMTTPPSYRKVKPRSALFCS